MWLGILALTVALPLSGPTAPDRAAPDTIPEPTRVTAKEFRTATSFPPSDTSTDGTTSPALYYLVFEGQSEQFTREDDPATILRTLVRRGFVLEDAWVPIPASIEVACMAPNVRMALVVRLKAPNDQILEFGFTNTPGGDQTNCGVEAFRHYDFTASALHPPVRQDPWGSPLSSDAVS